MHIHIICIYIYTYPLAAWRRSFALPHPLDHLHEPGTRHLRAERLPARARVPLPAAHLPAPQRHHAHAQAGRGQVHRGRGRALLPQLKLCISTASLSLRRLTLPQRHHAHAQAGRGHVHRRRGRAPLPQLRLCISVCVFPVWVMRSSVLAACAVPCGPLSAALCVGRSCDVLWSAFRSCFLRHTYSVCRSPPLLRCSRTISTALL